MSFVNVFGGTTIYPADVAYRDLPLTANTTLEWPTELASSANILASIMDVTPTGGTHTIRLPAANLASVGETALFFNVGAVNFIIADNGGNTLVTVAPGLAWQVYLTDNVTANGVWRSTQYGAGTSSATAGSLVGAGIKAIGTTLNQSMPSSSLNTNYTVGVGDRAQVLNWTGGAGTFTLPSAATAGADWFFNVRNSGTGSVTISPSVGGQFINGGASLVMNPGDSAVIFCDSAGFFTVGLGKSAAFAFDFVSIDLTAQSSPYTLSGANLNRIAYRFTGTITGNMEVVAPATVQQYWFANETSLASAPYTITLKTASGSGVNLSRNQRAIVYCDGTNVVDADTGGISIPLTIAQGGTGATTESGARINLGGTSTGIAVFTAVSASSARNSLGSGATGDAIFTAANTAAAQAALGTITVPNGGTGATTLTGVVKGNGTSAFTAGTVSLTSEVSGTLPVANGGTGVTSSTGTVAVVLSNSPTLVTPNLGTPSAVTLTNATGLPLTTGVTGTLPVANGGTGQTTYTNGQLLIGNTTGNTLTKATLTAGSGVSITNGTGSITISATGSGGTVTSVDASGGTTGMTFSGGPVTGIGTLTLAGTLAVANGGTGTTTAFTAGSVVFAGASGVYSQDNANLFWDNANDRLGIGTSSPAVPLEVAGNIRSLGLLQRVDNSGLTLVGGTTFNTTGASMVLRGSSSAFNAYGMEFYAGGFERMRVISNGNVGIGTSTPDAVLDVNGSQVTRGDASGFVYFAPKIGTTPFGANYDRFEIRVDPSTQVTLLGNVNGGTGAARALAFLAGTNERMRIDTAGNVGIGTASPSVKFQIEQNQAAFSYFDFYNTTAGGGIVWRQIVRNIANSGTTSIDFAKFLSGGFALNNNDINAANFTAFGVGGTERMRIDSSGNVGIGTSSPGVRFDVTGQGRLGNGVAQASPSATDIASTSHTILGGQGGNALFVGQYPTTFASWIQSSFTNPTTATYNIVLQPLGGNVGIGTTSISYKLEVAGDVRIAGGGGDLRIQSATGTTSTGGDSQIYNDANNMIFTTGTTTAERMRIDSSGNVGIGTSGPGYRLDIAAGDTTAGLGYAMRLRSNATATAATIQFTTSTVSTQNGLITCTDAGAMVLQSDGASSLLAFRTNGSERMRVASDGKVGIGTSSPDSSAALDVSSTTAGFLPPRMNTAARDLINGGNPADGLVIYNVTTEKLQVYVSPSWINLH